MTISRKKLTESAVKLRTFCSNHRCRECIFHTDNQYANCLLVGCPKDWCIPVNEINIKLNEDELDELVTAVKDNSLADKLQKLRNKLKGAYND